MNATAPLDLIDPSPHHHRTMYGDMEALAASIKSVGIIHALVVRRVGPRLELVAGERRRRAAGLAGLVEVPVDVRDLSDDQAIEIQARENIDRQNLHPMDEAAYYADFSARGYDVGDIARRFARPRGEVVRRLRLLSLIPAARTAYARGHCDDDGALAIAVQSPSVQTDVIAALEVGSLQTEEVVGYCRREFTASLAELPWRLDDAEVVPLAGACAACPKRSGQQRDLFVDMPGDRCLDIACYRSKMDASYALALKRADGVHVVICDSDTPSVFVPTAGGRPAVMKSSGYVDAEGGCPHLTGHTWREAVHQAADSENMPGEIIARDQDGRPRVLYREAIVSKLVRRSDAAQAARDAAAAADPTRSDETIVARVEQRIRKAVIEQIAEQSARTDADAWGWIVERVLSAATSRSRQATAHQFEDELRELGVEVSADGLVELVRKSNRRAKQVAIAVLVREEADVVGELPDTLKDLAKVCGVDVRAIERQIRKDREP